jgi:hypothetical protein
MTISKERKQDTYNKTIKKPLVQKKNKKDTGSKTAKKPSGQNKNKKDIKNIIFKKLMRNIVGECMPVSK